MQTIGKSEFSELIEHESGNIKSIVSTDPYETEEFATSLFCPHSFRLAHGEHKLRTRISFASLSAVSIASIGFGAEVTVDPDTLDDFFLVQATVDGIVNVESANQAVSTQRGDATVISPYRPTRMYWNSAGKFFTVKIDKRSLEHQLAVLIGQELQQSLTFDLKMDLRADHTRPWQDVVRAVHSHLTFSDWATSHSTATDHLENWLMTTLLYTQPHNYSRHLQRSSAEHAPQSIRKATRFMKKHIGDRLSNRSIAEAAGVSERTLHNHFRTCIGRTPKEYLLDLKLRLARQLLINAGPTTSVTQAFSDVGIHHCGRFANLYNARFDEFPSETLAIARERRRLGHKCEK